MVKYLIWTFVIYYLYVTLFLPKKVEEKGFRDEKSNQNKADGEYVDYEEVD